MPVFVPANPKEVEAKRQQMALDEERKRLQGLNYSNLNQDGSALGLRAAVATAQTPEDKLATLRSRYPTATPYGNGNYAYIDENGAPRVHNPRGVDRGDFIEQGRIGAEIVGGIAGFVGGTAAAVPTAATGVGAPAAATLPYLGAGTGATLAGEIYDRGVRAFTGAEDTRSAGDQAKNMALNVGLNALPVDKAIDAAKPVVSGFGTKLANSEIIQAANRRGFQPTLGMISNNPAIQKIEAAFSGMFLTAGSARKRGEEAVDSARQSIDDFFNAGGGRADATGAGSDIINLAENARVVFRDESEKLYNAVDDLIDPSKIVETPNLTAHSDTLTSAFSNEELAGLMNKGLVFDLAKLDLSQLPYRDLKSLRTRVGKIIHSGKSDTLTGALEADLKSLYAAISSDMGMAAKEVGENAFSAWKQADSFYSDGAKVFKDVIDPLTKSASGDILAPEVVFNNLKSQATKRPSDLAKTSDAGMIPESAGGALVENLGKATPRGQNAAETAGSLEGILTQTSKDKIPQASQDILFNGTQKEILSDLRVFAENARDVTQNLNRSNTAGVMAVQGGLASVGLVGASVLTGDLTVASAPAVAGLLTTYLAGKGFSSKALRDWAMRAPSDPKALAGWKRAGLNIASANGLEKVFNAAFGNDSDGQGVLAE